ncbi:MAG TPA: ROK family protein, partial [Longilinea sp.]|nr:ROK family protein [Longilinea sp.]
EPEHIEAEIRIPTTTPQETLGKVIDFFLPFTKSLKALGIASFGPVDLHPNSPTYGHITSTPKAGWHNADVLGPIQNALHIPTAFDTDVNGAAVGEYRWGAGQGIENLIYLTIGTGIGGGAIASGQPQHGMLHAEMGHIYLPHDWQRDPFKGVCPYHGDCFEGIASGPSMQQRWGVSADQLPAEHPAWALEAHYIALALQDYICILSPERIILGGGVMQQLHLFPLIRAELKTLLNGYIDTPEIIAGIDQYIVPPGLGNRAGVLGALALANRLIA